MVRITAEVEAQICEHALRQRPNEACGLFTAEARSDMIDRFHPITNTAASPTRFSLDPREMLTVEREAEAANRDVVGVMHSHVTTAAYPSPTDVRDSALYDPSGRLLQVIVSLERGLPVVRCYRIAHCEIIELPLVSVPAIENEVDHAR